MIDGSPRWWSISGECGPWPRKTWSDKEAYDQQAEKLVQMFADNFAQYVPFIDDDVKAVAIG